VGPGQLAQVEASEHRVPQLEQAEAEPVTAGAGNVLDEASVGERCEQPGHGARVDPGPSRDLVRSELDPPARRAGSGSVRIVDREGIEHRDGALDRGDVTDGWLSGAGHGTLESVRF
jgi:hypothetical protein